MTVINCSLCPFTTTSSYALGVHKTIKHRRKDAFFSKRFDARHSHNSHNNTSAYKPSLFLSSQLGGLRDRLILDANTRGHTVPCEGYESELNYVPLQADDIQDVPIESNHIVRPQNELVPPRVVSVMNELCNVQEITGKRPLNNILCALSACTPSEMQRVTQ